MEYGSGGDNNVEKFSHVQNIPSIDYCKEPKI